LPDLPNTLTDVYCGINQLSVLPKLPSALNGLCCGNNQLSILPSLPNSLMFLECEHNRLNVLPDLPSHLGIIYYHTPIYDMLKTNDTNIIRQNVCILNKFRRLYYSLKFKRQFHDWLWERVRRPKIEMQYHPDNLAKQLVDEDTDLDIVLDKW